MSFSHETQIETLDRFWCSACGRVATGKLEAHVGNNPAGSQNNLPAVCASCGKRSKAATKDAGESHHQARPSLPILRFRRGPETPIRKIKRHTADDQSCATAHDHDGRFVRERGGGTLQTDLLTAALIAKVKQGKRTVCHLKEQLGDGLAYVEDKGPYNVEPELLMLAKALHMAIQRIEIELSDPGRHRDN